MRYPEYKSWAKDAQYRDASWTDWHGLSLAEASGRALALIQSVDNTYTQTHLIIDHLEQFAKAINNKYPPRR